MIRRWMRSQTWLIWAIGYPCAMFDRVVQAHRWAISDVAAFVSDVEKKRHNEEPET